MPAAPAERLRRTVARWDREDRGEHLEPYVDVVARDRRYELDAAGVMYRVIRAPVAA